MPPSEAPSTSTRSYLLRLALAVAIAIGLGLLLFLLVWMRDHRSRQYSLKPAAPPVSMPEFSPLPTPQSRARQEDVASSVDKEGTPPPSAARPHIEEPPRPPPPPAPAPAPAPVASSPPVPLEMPPPRYPPSALRRGESGTVLVRIEVGVDGVPSSVRVERSSRSRDLDRAALDAVRRWRFRPALANGQPTTGSVDVPIEFQSPR